MDQNSVLKNMGAPMKSHKAVHGIAIALSVADGIPTERQWPVTHMIGLPVFQNCIDIMLVYIVLSDNPEVILTIMIRDNIRSLSYREYNPDSTGTRRDECLVGDSHRQVLVNGNKDIEVVQE